MALQSERRDQPQSNTSIRSAHAWLDDWVMITYDILWEEKKLNGPGHEPTQDDEDNFAGDPSDVPNGFNPPSKRWSPCRNWGENRGRYTQSSSLAESQRQSFTPPLTGVGLPTGATCPNTEPCGRGNKIPTRFPSKGLFSEVVQADLKHEGPMYDLLKSVQHRAKGIRNLDTETTDSIANLYH
ncbi:hypothetical protein BDR22DRAFT_825102 [Usnea florida]